MKKQSLKLFFCLFLVLGLSLAVGAQDFGWMQPGVRAWYFGGSSGLTTMNADEAYLIQAIAGGNVNYVRHSAAEFWTSPKPVENLIEPVSAGSFWIHPTVLQTIAANDFWLDTKILYVTRDNYTYATLTAAMGVPYNLLPARALFELKAQRQIVKITYTIPGTYSQGRAFFDADTGLCLLRDTIFEGYTTFFILGEINYDFAQQAAFAEDGGPHCGFRPRVAENSLGGGGHSSGVVDILFGVETRYGNKVEMWVQSSWGGPGGTHPLTFENYYFDGNVPILRRINHDQAGNLPPDQWNAFGQYLPWWLPATVTQGAAFPAGSLALSTINLYSVSMTKTADSPLTYMATQNPQQFYFGALYFDGYGYLTKFSAKDPTKGLDLDAGYLFGNETKVDGLSYYRSTMGTATPAERATIKSDFNKDGHEDILWRSYGPGGYNVVWYLGDSGSGPAGIEGSFTNKPAGEYKAIDMLKGQGLKQIFVDPREPGMMFNEKAPRQIFWDAPEARRLPERGSRESREAQGQKGVPAMRSPAETKGAGEKGMPVMRVAELTWMGNGWLPAVTDPNWKIGGIGDFNGDKKVDIVWRNYGVGGDNVVWYLNGVNWAGNGWLPTVTDPNWKIAGTGDFNGDGKVDILWRNYGAGGDNVVWYMDGVNWIGNGWLPTVTDTNWTIAGTGDFNRDGKVDIVWRNYGAGGYNAVWYMDGVKLAASEYLPAVTDTSWEIAGTGDFNRDGKVDIVWRNDGAGGDNVVWYMDGAKWAGNGWLPPVADINWRIENH